MTAFGDGVTSRLAEAAEVYETRNAVYGDNFRKVGKVMEALFPEGLNAAEKHEFERLHIFELIIVKLTRYAQSYSTGGHEDSLNDMIAYIGILGGLDDELREELVRRAEAHAHDIKINGK